MSVHTEICIVGAGPAGAITALFLAQKGIPHIIIDAASFPRDKVCGDGLDLKAMRVLNHLDPSIVQETLPRHPHFSLAKGARFFMPNRRELCLAYTPKAQQQGFPLYWVSKRANFDHFLVQRFDPAYTDFWQRTKVEQLHKTADGWRIEAVAEGKPIELSCKLLIGADGDHSVVLRHLGERKIERQHYAASQRQYWSGVEGLHPDGLIEFYFPASLPWSYFWIFPLPNGEANVGFIMMSHAVAKYKVNVRRELQRLIEEDPLLAPRFKQATPLDKPAGWGLPLASRQRKPYGEGYLLAGDAASLICPLTGEGIGTSMLSGYLAAQFAQRAFEQKKYDTTVLRGYEREIFRRLANEVRLAQWLRYGQLLPWSWCAWALNRVLSSPVLPLLFRRLANGWMETAFKKTIQLKH